MSATDGEKREESKNNIKKYQKTLKTPKNIKKSQKNKKNHIFFILRFKMPHFETPKSHFFSLFFNFFTIFFLLFISTKSTFYKKIIKKKHKKFTKITNKP